MHTTITSLSLMVALIVSSIALGGTIYVPDNAETIQDAIEIAVDGDSVVVRPGRYVENLNFRGKAIIVRSEEGPRATIIDGGNPSNPDSASVVTFTSDEGPDAVLEGFTLTNGTGTHINWNLCGGGIVCDDGASPTIRGNVIVGNSATHNGGGVAVSDDSSPILIGNLVTGNEAANQGGGIRCYNGSMVVANCTLTGNLAQGGGGVSCSYSPSVTITNAIMWGNEATTGNELSIGDAYTAVTISFSDAQGGQEAVYIVEGAVLNWGEGMIDSAPMFVLPEKRDCRLLWGSPCIDTGDPDSLDSDGTRSDMGAYFFNQDDYLTMYLTPDSTSVPVGGQLSVTYTAINRWSQSEVLWLLTKVFLPGGHDVNILGPRQFTIPANHTAQVHLLHGVPEAAPLGSYSYRASVGLPPSTLYDSDKFWFEIVGTSE